MTEHARPHLQTHVRSQKQSAVAGAAYRLGIKLLDERTHTWHDYSKRAGSEVVFSETVAPAGAPAWATNPAELWNLVEKAETKANSQIARDYRIPLPLGIPDTDATGMAIAMARFIVAELHVPVSIGIHRDSDRNLAGEPKPLEKIGLHAHLYFPTRKLVIDEAAGEGGEGGRGHFGEKLSHLSNKNTSGAFVEAANRKWADLANYFAKKNGLTPDYDHRSYRRAGIDKVPTPRIHRVPRRPLRPTGLPTRTVFNGSFQPGQRQLEMSQVHVLERIQQQRITSKTTEMHRNRREAREDIRLRGHTAAVQPAALSRTKVVGGRTLVLDNALSLAEFVRRAGPKPMDDASRAAMERQMLLADFLESLLFAFERARQEDGDFRMQLHRESLALAEARARRALMEAELREADDKLERWLRKHPLRARLHVPTGEHGLLVERRNKVKDLADTANQAVQSHKKNVRQLNAARDSHSREEGEVRSRIIAMVADHKSDYRQVLELVSSRLDPSQQATLERVGEELGIPTPGLEDVIDLARAERAFDDLPPMTRPAGPGT